MKFKARISVLLLLLVVEIGLLYAFVNHGWKATTTWLIWLQAIAIAGIPIGIAVVLLARGRMRLSIRSLMVIVACAGTFVAISVLPINQAKELRYGFNLLTENGAELEVKNWWARYFEAIDDPLPVNLTAYSTERELPGWLMPLAGDITKPPKDNQILVARISSQRQLSLLLNNAKRFESLQMVSIYGTDLNHASILKFCNRLSEFPNLIGLHVGGCVIPEDCLPKLTKIRCLSIAVEKMEAQSDELLLPVDQLNEIGELPSLQILQIGGYQLKDTHLDAFTPQKSLRMLHLWENSVTESGIEAFKSSHPNCQVTLFPSQ